MRGAIKATARKRRIGSFLMGNALVAGVVARIAKVLAAELRPENFLGATTIRTEQDRITDGRRAFLIGNALVVGIIAKIRPEFTSQIADKAHETDFGPE